MAEAQVEENVSPNEGTQTPPEPAPTNERPAIPELYNAWSAERTARGEDPNDYAAFAQHLQAIEGAGTSSAPPPPSAAVAPTTPVQTATAGSPRQQTTGYVNSQARGVDLQGYDGPDQAWARAFQREHGGQAPTREDYYDRLWSLDFAGQTGRPPTLNDWRTHYYVKYQDSDPGQAAARVAYETGARFSPVHPLGLYDDTHGPWDVHWQPAATAANAPLTPDLGNGSNPPTGAANLASKGTVVTPMASRYQTPNLTNVTPNLEQNALASAAAATPLAQAGLGWDQFNSKWANDPSTWSLDQFQRAWGQHQAQLHPELVNRDLSRLNPISPGEENAGLPFSTSGYVTPTVPVTANLSPNMPVPSVLGPPVPPATSFGYGTARPVSGAIPPLGQPGSGVVTMPSGNYSEPTLNLSNGLWNGLDNFGGALADSPVTRAMVNPLLIPFGRW